MTTGLATQRSVGPWSDGRGVSRQVQGKAGLKEIQ